MVCHHHQKVKKSSFQSGDFSVTNQQRQASQGVGQASSFCRAEQAVGAECLRLSENITFLCAVGVQSKPLACPECQNVLPYVIQYTDDKVAHNLMWHTATDSQLNRPAKNHIIPHRGNHVWYEYDLTQLTKPDSMYQANHADKRNGRFSENRFLTFCYFPKHSIKVYFLLLFWTLPTSLKAMEKSLISWVVGSGPETAVV